MKKRVVITGLGVVSPIGIGLDAYWNSLSQGRVGYDTITMFDPSPFPCRVGAEVKGFEVEKFIEKKKARRMDRFTRYAVAAAKMAVKDAQFNMESLRKERVGVIVGSGIGGLTTIETEHKNLLNGGPRRVSPFLIPMLITNMAPGEIAIEFGFVGPNYSVSSACATSNHAIGEALRHLRYGDADVILAGGSESCITPLALAGFCQAKALTFDFNETPSKASRPFDAKRSGFVMAEGSGVVILETEEHAKARGAKIYAELCGYGATDDAYHITAPNPNGLAAVRAMQLAMEDADVKPEEVDYINAHGTSTTLNDKTETAAVKVVFGTRAKNIPISSTKSMTGHLLGAAGAIELIATLLSMKNSIVHPTANYDNPDPECDLDYVPNKARSLKINCALSNSLGFGGHNAVLVVKNYN